MLMNYLPNTTAPTISSSSGSSPPVSGNVDISPPKHGQRWGNWTYNGPNLTHQHPYYEVDLGRCEDAKNVVKSLKRAVTNGKSKGVRFFSLL